MDWEKPSPELTRILESAADPFPVIERKKMFGCPAYYINGNMFAGVYGQQIFLRLSPDDRAELDEGLGAKPFEPMPGRPMKDYVQMPPAVWSDDASMDEWMRRSVEFTASLPAKQPKPKNTAGAPGAGSSGAPRRAPKPDPKGPRS
jgi:TfoX/Sxy family transcriptional regulator of competence genes